MKKIMSFLRECVAFVVVNVLFYGGIIIVCMILYVLIILVIIAVSRITGEPLLQFKTR